MTSPEILMWHTLASQGEDFIFGFRWRQGGAAYVWITQWPGPKTLSVHGTRWKVTQIPPPVDRQLLITTCDNRRPPPRHPSLAWEVDWPQGKSALRVFPRKFLGDPASLSRSWTVCGEPGVSHSYMDQNDGKGNNDKWFFLSVSSVSPIDL